MALKKFVFARSRSFVLAASVSMIASVPVELRAADSFEGEESASFADDDFDGIGSVECGRDCRTGMLSLVSAPFMRRSSKGPTNSRSLPFR